MDESEKIKELLRADKEIKRVWRSFTKDILIFMFTLGLTALGIGFSILITNHTSLGKGQQINLAADTVQVESLNKLQSDLASLGNRVNLYANTSSSTPSANIDTLTTRVTQLENKEQALSDTILVDADKALTASFLREKQKEDENAIADIKLNQAYLSQKNDALSQKIDNLEITLVAVPLGTFVLTILVAGVTALFKWKKK